MIVRSDNNIAYDNVMTPIYNDRVIADGGTIETLTEVEEVLSDLGNQDVVPSILWVAEGSKVGKDYSILPNDGSGDFNVTRPGDTSFTQNPDLTWRPALPNEPRFIYENGVKGRLVEAAATNLLPYYKSFARSEWAKVGAVIEGDASTAGSELVVNGGFDVDENWIKSSGWSIEDGLAKSDGVNSGVYITQELNYDLKVGNFYLIEFDVVYVSGILRLYTGGSASNRFDVPSISNHVRVFIYIQTKENNIIGFRSNFFNGSIDNVSVKEVSGFTCPVLNSDGSNSMAGYKLMESTNNGIHSISTTFNAVSGTTYTQSIIAKSAGNNRGLILSLGGVKNAVFNVDAKTLVQTNNSAGFVTTISTEIKELPDGWCKYSVTYTALTNAVTDIRFFLTSTASSTDTSYQGDGTSGIYISHANLVQASAPSSPIGGTEGTTQTRNDDNITLPSTGYDAIKTIILDDVGYTFPNTKDYNSFRLPVGSYRRGIASNAELSVLQITALGATTVYEDALVMPISGNPLNPASPTNGTIVFSATSDVDVVATGDVVIVSTTRAADSTFRSHDVVISCANGKSGTIVVKQASRIVSLGNHNGASNPTTNFYVGTDATAPRLTWDLDSIPVNCQKINQATQLLTILPAIGYNALPINLTFITWIGDNIYYYYNGSFPTNLTHTYLRGSNINWSYNGSLPIGISYYFFRSSNINWIGNTFGNPFTPKPNVISFQFNNFRNPSESMDYTDLLSMLNSLINNVGTLPPTINLGEQIPVNVTAIAAASPDENGTDAEKCKYYINFIKSTKSVTAFTLNSTNI